MNSKLSNEEIEKFVSEEIEQFKSNVLKIAIDRKHPFISYILTQAFKEFEMQSRASSFTVVAKEHKFLFENLF